VNARAEPSRGEPPQASPAGDPWADALTMAALLAVDPLGLGGVVVRAAPGPVRDAFLAAVKRLQPEGAVLRRVPHTVPDSRLLGGLDLAATLRTGRPVAERGILAEADGGLLLLAMAERLPPGTAARIAAVLDAGAIAAERDGLRLEAPTRFAVIALDEGMQAEERVPAALAERLAFSIGLDGVHPRATLPGTRPDIAAARLRLPRVEMPEGMLRALCGTALALGIVSLRAPLLALRAACAAAALAGRTEPGEEDAALAARLVLAPRALCLPAPEAEQALPPPPPAPEDSEPPRQEEEQIDPDMLREVVLAAAAAAIPADLLARLRLAGAAPRRAGEGGAGQQRAALLRGRPIGTRPGALRQGQTRLSLVETLRAAAPWQGFRRAERQGRPHPRVIVTREDVRIRRFRERTGSVAIFLVDASGSAALHRLAEAKGAVELLLADCYVRRDQVALIAFRGTGADLLLPPTGSLVRAKRCLAGLPGGGGTPLAAGLDAARALADQVRRRGRSPVLILLTDGRANVARDGQGGRARAEAEALSAARLARAESLTALVVDTAPRPQPQARAIAEAMGARYLPLPMADGRLVSEAARAALAAA
jgi:magnesium chelatase subunit D